MPNTRPDWTPFLLCEPGKRPPRPRSITTIEGISDRVRAAAFAEIQAREAFLWAAQTFSNSPATLRQSWEALARAEDRHLRWLVQRLSELGTTPDARPVSDYLWRSFMSCESAEAFSLFMASAEERGRQAGEKFHREMFAVDPTSARLFEKIAQEEIEHIELAKKYFNWSPNLLSSTPKTSSASIR